MLFILAPTKSSQENYENVSQLRTAININKFDGTNATDLKLAHKLITACFPVRGALLTKIFLVSVPLSERLVKYHKITEKAK